MNRTTFTCILLFVFVSSGLKATRIEGDITQSTCWKVSDSPIEFSGNVNLYNGAELLIEPGVIVHFNDYTFNIGYSSSAGTLTAEQVQFKNRGIGNQLRIRYNSITQFKECSFNKVALTVENSSISLCNDTIINVDYPLSTTPSSHLKLESVLLENVKEAHIRLGGYVNGPSVLQKLELPYFLSSSIYVRNGDSLTIADGVELDLANRDIIVGLSGTAGYLLANKVSIFSTADSDAEIMFDEQSGGFITNSVLNHVYLHIANGSPHLTNNTISHVRVPLRYDLSSNFLMTGLKLRAIENPVFEIGGKTNGNCSLKQDSIPYVLYKNISVCGGDTLSVESHLSVDLNGHDIMVGTTDGSESFLMADGVHFFSSYYTHDKSIVFGKHSGGNISNCTLKNVNLKINEGKPVVNKVAIADVDFPFTLDIANNMEPTQLSFTNVKYPGIALHGNLRGSRYLKKAPYPYYLDGSIHILNNDTLEIEKGTSIIFASDESIRVGFNYTCGYLIAKKVSFSRDNTKPDASIEFNNGSKGILYKSLLNNVYVKVTNGSPYLSNLVISNVFYPIRIGLEGIPVFKHVSFSNVKYPVIGLEGYSNGNCVLETNNIPIRFSDDVVVSKHDTLTFEKGAIIDMGKHNLEIGNITPGYLNLNGVTITSDASIENELVFKDGSEGLILNSTFEGVQWRVEDVSAPKFHHNLLSNTDKAFSVSISAQSVFSNTRFTNVADTSIFLNGFLSQTTTLKNYPYPIKLESEICIQNNAVLTIPKGSVIDFNGNSISLGSSDNSKGGIKADSVFFVNSGEYRGYLYFRNGNDSSCITHTLFDNVLTMFRFGSPTINYCDFLNVEEAFYHYEYDGSTNVKYNYWGSINGPKHCTNPLGKGEPLSDSIQFKPFRTSPNLISYAKPYPEIRANLTGGIAVQKDSSITVRYLLVNNGADAARGVYCFSMAGNVNVKRIHSLADEIQQYNPGDTIYCLETDTYIIAEHRMIRLIFNSFGSSQQTVEIELAKNTNERAWVKHYFQLEPEKVYNKFLSGYRPVAVYPLTGTLNQEGRVSEELFLESFKSNYKADLNY